MEEIHEDENPLFETCPECGYLLGDADFDFQICSRCGWDSEKMNEASA